MAFLKTCCCWNNVRSGSLASGIYTLILSLINGGIIGFNLNFLNNTNRLDEYFQVTRGWFLATLVVCLLLLVSSVALIIGIQRDIRQLFLPWVAVTILMIAMDTAALIYECVSFGLLTFSIVQMVIWLALALINVYCILCVLSQYQELKAGRGTLEFREQQDQHIMYHPHVQAVHFTQGPIMLTCASARIGGQGHNVHSVTTTTTTVSMQPPPDYNAVVTLPKYGSSYHPPAVAGANQAANHPQTDPLLDKKQADSDSPPPPYSP